MKICVCFKVTAEYDEAAKNVWKHPNHPDFSFVKHSFGCFDESALETALRIKDDCLKMGEEAELEAVTLGSSDYVLHQGLYARGFDKVTVIEGKNDSLHSRYTAGALADFLKDSEFNIIIMGKMAGPNSTGTVPYYLAKELNLPVISDVSSIHMRKINDTNDNRIIIERHTDKGSEYLEPMTRVLCILNEAEASNLRLFTLMQMGEAQEKKIVSVKSVRKDNAASSAKTEVPVSGGKACRIINDESLGITEILNQLRGVQNENIFD